MAPAPVDVFNASGRLVTTLDLSRGPVAWDARGVPAGVYWLRLGGGERARALRLVLTR